MWAGQGSGPSKTGSGWVMGRSWGEQELGGAGWRWSLRHQRGTELPILNLELLVLASELRATNLKVRRCEGAEV